MKTIRNALILSVAALSIAASSAHAGGLIGDGLNALTGTNIGTTLDRANAQLGNPVDHAFAGAANAVVPGSGAVIEGYYAYNRGGVPGLIQQQTGMPVPPMQNIGINPGMAPMGPAMRPAIMPAVMPQPVMGNLCATPVGVFPGPFNPVGMPCNAMTVYGPAFGRVIQ